MAGTPASTFVMGNLHVPMPSAYSAKVDTGFADRIRANYRLGAFSCRLTGFRLAGKKMLRGESKAIYFREIND
jgi:hypothetical protein